MTCEPQCVVALTNALQCETNIQVRQASFQALAEIAAPETLPFAMAALPHETNDLVSASIVVLLGNLRDSKAVPLLASALRTNQAVAGSAATALGTIADQVSLGDLIEAVRHHSDINVRQQAIIALDKFQVPDVTSGLIEILRADAASRVRQSAAQELEKHPAAAASTMLGSTNGLSALQIALHSRETWQRFAAVLALARSRSPLAQPLLQSRSQDRVPAIRKLALAAQIGKASASLAESLRDRDRDIRHYSARALIFFNDPATFPALRRACQDPIPEVRTAARVTLRYLERLQPKPVGE